MDDFKPNDNSGSVSPLYDPLLDTSQPQGIRESDYGDREDVVAEHEELRHELEALDDNRPIYYPPSGTSAGSNKSRRRRRLNALSFGLRKHKARIHLLGLFVIVWPLINWGNHPALFPKTLKEAKSTMLVVAHPDDECLFFAPSVLATIWRAQTHGALLVMSTGGHYGLGETRKKELKASCKVLGIRDERCDVIDISSIQDDPKQWWPVDAISQIVNTHIDQWMIDSIITFDRYGISGHINHRAVSAAVTQLALSRHSTHQPDSKESKSHPPLSLFVLESVFVLRKYMALYDLPLSFIRFIPNLILGPSQLHNQPMNPAYDAVTEQSTQDSELRRKRANKVSERGLLISGWQGYRTARNAFWSHRTQMVWDRHLYMILSRYMYFNTIERVV